MHLEEVVGTDDLILKGVVQEDNATELYTSRKLQTLSVPYRLQPF